MLTLARWAVAIENHYSARAGHPTPMDIEWAKDGQSGKLYIVQARPETVHAQKQTGRLEVFHLHGGGRVLARGKSVGGRIGAGVARVIRSARGALSFRDGEVLVAPSTDPDWEPVLKRAAAVVTEQGGRTCHAAIVSRELGLPCVVGTGDATRTIRGGPEVTVSCAEGDEGRVYEGKLPFEREEIDPAALPTPRVPIMLNVGDPGMLSGSPACPAPASAWRASSSSCRAGSGSIRWRFFTRSGSSRPRPARDRTRIAGWATPAEFFVDRLATGVAQIGAAFYPRPVIVRFSDFKTNEYAGLLGGAAVRAGRGQSR